MALFGLRRRGADTVGRPSRAWVRDLEKVVSSLPEAPRVADYVLTGRDPAVLGVLSNLMSASHISWLPRGNGDTGKADLPALRSLYAGLGTVDASVLRRWGHVLDAVQGRRIWGRTVAPVAGTSWHDLMIAQMVAATPAPGPLPGSFVDIARIAALDEVGPAGLVTAMLTIETRSHYCPRYTCAQLGRLPGFGDALLAHPDRVTAMLTAESVDARVAALGVVGAALTDDELSAVVDPLVEAATGTSRQVREHAAALLGRVAGAASAALRVTAVQGSPQVRGRALELLAARPEDLEWARKTALADRAASVQALVTKWDAAVLVDPPEDDDRPEPLPPIRWAVPRQAAEACARRLVAELSSTIEGHNQGVMARSPGQGAGRALPLPTERTFRDVVAVLVSDAAPSTQPWLEAPPWSPARLLFRLAGDGLLDTVSAVKLIAALGILETRDTHSGGAAVLDDLYRRTGKPDLRTLQVMFDEMGLDGRARVWASYSRSYGSRLGRGWDDADVWPFVAEHLEWILAEPSRTGWEVDELALFAATATLPARPARLVDALVPLALESRKALRGPAQEALAGVPRSRPARRPGFRTGRATVALSRRSG